MTKLALKACSIWRARRTLPIRNIGRNRERDSCAKEAISILGSKETEGKTRAHEPEGKLAGRQHSGRDPKWAGLTNPKRKKRRATPSSQPFSMVTAPKQLWCMDFSAP